jgi:F-type H+-transporting ATPase subunit delta
VAKFDELSARLSADDLTKLSAELAAVYTLLVRESTLARYLADTGGVTGAKKLMLEQLLARKVGADTLAILSTAVSARWSTNKDFAHCVEHISRLSLLERAEREQQAEEVAEQIFRFGRVLEGQPRLTSLLSDYHEPASGRVALLRSILDASHGANATTIALLAQSIELLHGERFDEVVTDLSQLAVARRGEIVAEVGAAADLSEAQRQRLNQVLTRIYHHPVSVQLTIGPRLLGGLSVAVGDEVIDGTLSSRLAVAALKLPS